MPPIDYDISLWALSWMSIAIHSSGNSFSQCLPRVQQHFTKVFPSPRFQRRLCKSPSRNNHSRFFCCVDNTVADIPPSRSNARIPLYDALTASNLGTAYRIRRSYWKRKNENMKTIWMKTRNIKAKWIQLQTSPARPFIRYYFHGEWRYFCLLITSARIFFWWFISRLFRVLSFSESTGKICTSFHECREIESSLAHDDFHSKTGVLRLFAARLKLCFCWIIKACDIFSFRCKNSSEPLTPKQFWRNPFQHEGKLPKESDPLCESFS